MGARRGGLLRTKTGSLPIPREAPREENIERFLAGKVKPPAVASAALAAIADVLERHGYVPATGWPDSLGFPSPAFLMDLGLSNLRLRWDSGLVWLRGGGLSAQTYEYIAITAARLLAIDIAVRAGAWLVLTKHPLIDANDAPTLPTIEGIAEDVLVASKLSAPKLAERVGVERTTVDRWRSGARLTEETLGFVSEFLASLDSGDDVQRVRHGLRRRIAIAETLRDLGAVPAFTGEVDDLWTTFWWLARNVARRLMAFGEEVPARLLTSLVMQGASCPVAVPILAELCPTAPAQWRADLQTGAAWTDRLLYAAQVGHGVAATKSSTSLPEWATADLIDAAAHHVLSVPTVDVHPVPDGWTTRRLKDPPEAAVENRRMQAQAARMRRDHETAILHLRRAVELVPTHAEAHFELGANLWMAGDFDEALRECEIAAALRPEWELPKVEVGIILLNADRPREARDYLEKLLAASPAPSTHLRYNLASARWQCDDFAGALDLFELVLADECYQSYPHALSQAAHCAFKIGDRVRGLDLAKRARDLGDDEAYRLWSVGAYGT